VLQVAEFEMVPDGVAVDGEGHIIVSDARNNSIQIFSPTGVFVRRLGVGGVGPGEFQQPGGVCVLPDGGVVVVDAVNDRIQVF
jgi:DNA-binding beta-propeller fold protein YncE